MSLICQILPVLLRSHRAVRVDEFVVRLEVALLPDLPRAFENAHRVVRGCLPEEQVPATGTEREDETVDGASGPPTVSIDGRLAIGLFS